MKKLLFVAIAALAFTACSKDDEKTPETLTGTTWEYKYDETNGNERIEGVYTIEFTTSTAFSLTDEYEYFNSEDPSENYDNFEDPDVSTGSYSYTKPEATGTFLDGDFEGENFVGEVDGNRMSIVFEGQDEGVVFKKK